MGPWLGNGPVKYRLRAASAMPDEMRTFLETPVTIWSGIFVPDRRRALTVISMDISLPVIPEYMREESGRDAKEKARSPFSPGSITVKAGDVDLSHKTVFSTEW